MKRHLILLFVGVSLPFLLAAQQKNSVSITTVSYTHLPITTWDYWEINAEGVQSVKFNFEGSDSGAYGLNTPAYICIDDITIQ